MAFGSWGEYWAATRLEARSENVPHAVSDRVSFLARSHRNTLQRPTQAQRREYAIASAEFTSELGKLRALIEKELPPLQRALEEAGAPWVPGRLPEWKGK